MRRATLLCAGTRGDVMPYLALGEALAATGIAVTVACPEAYAPSVRARGLGFAPLAFDPAALLADRRRDGGVIGQMRWLADGITPTIRGLFADSLAAARGADVVVGSLLAISAGHVAEALGVPFVAAYLQPASRTREHPVTSLSLGGGGFGWLNLLSHDVSAALAGRLMRDGVDGARREVLGLGRAARTLPLGSRVVYGYSTHVVPRPRDWGAQIAVTGYWRDGRGAALDATLDRWLADEPAVPTVALAFGSMRDGEPAALAAIVDGVTHALGGVRAVVTSADAALRRALDGHARILVTDEAPHAALFSRVDAVIHHGGAGTVAAAICAGTPQVVVPFLGDQRFWGQRVAALGVGVGPLPRRSLTTRRLAGALTRCITDRTMRGRARWLGALVAREAGAERAAALIADGGARA